MDTWVPTPTFLYRNYLYKKITCDYSKSLNFLLIGTGSGYFLEWLSKKGFKGDAIDISKDSVDLTKEILGDNKNIKVKVADIFRYKPNKKYDLMFCFEVIEHIEDDQLAIEKMYKLLKPGGTLLFSVPAHMSLWAKMDEIGGHFRRYERNELKIKLKKAGFKIKKFWSYGFPFLRIIRMISRSGNLVKNFDFDKDNNMNKKTKRSGIRLEYDPRLKFFVGNIFVLSPVFWIMDLFVNTDWGLGYLVEAKKPAR